MSLFRKIFGGGNDSSQEDGVSEYNTPVPSNLPVDDLFTFNFKKNGGKFIYCENLNEVKEQFENILEENDWFESEVLCNETKLFGNPAPTISCDT